MTYQQFFKGIGGTETLMTYLILASHIPRISDMCEANSQALKNKNLLFNQEKNHETSNSISTRNENTGHNGWCLC